MKQPDVRPISTNMYRLMRAYTYEWQHVERHETHSHRIVIPAGFTYDGASVPRYLWSISGLRPDGLIRAAALVHDFIYIHKGMLPYGAQYQLIDKHWQPVAGRYSRKDADKLFRRIMLEAGIRPNLVKRAYLAVRMFGCIVQRF